MTVTQLTPNDDVQARLDASSPGDHFQLAPGLYDLDAPLRIPSSVILEGSGDETILQQTRELEGLSGVVILVEGVERVRISDLKVDGAGNQFGGILVNDAVDTLIERCNVRDFHLPGLGYGVPIIGASLRTVVRGCRFDSCRHAVSVGGHLHNRVRDTTVRDCVVTNSTDAGLDSHLEGRGISFLFNRVINSGTDGIIIQGSDFELRGNHVERSGRHGVLIQPLDRDCYGEIVGNRIQTTEKDAVAIVLGDTHPKYGRRVERTLVDIEGNHAAGARRFGLHVIERDGDPAVIQENDIPDHRIRREEP